MATTYTERGSIIIQVACMMVVLIGFTALTTDYGVLVMRQRRLQTGVDAAALAGAGEVYGPDGATAARDKALQIAASAGVINASVDVCTSQAPYTVTVRATETVPTIFARALPSAYASGRAEATATAAIRPAMSVARLRPWGIPWAFFNASGTGFVHFNEPATLALSPLGSEDPNSLGPNTTYISPLALDGHPDAKNSSLPRYTKYVREGYDKTVSISPTTTVTVLGQPGSLDSLALATQRALVTDPNALFTQAAADQYQNNNWQNPGESPRVVFLPVIDQIIGGEALIEGFAAFYIEGVEYNTIRGRFIRYHLPYSTTSPGTLDPQFYVPGMAERPQLVK